MNKTIALSIIGLLMVLAIPCFAEDEFEMAKAYYRVPSKVEVNSTVSFDKKKGAEIFVYSKHSEVDVYIDEEIAGKTPAVLTVVTKGKHLVEVFNGAELLYRQYIVLKNGEKIIIDINGDKKIAEEDPKFVI